MEKRKICYPAFLFALCLLLPVLSVFALCFGFTLEVNYPGASAVIMSVAAAVITSLSLWKKDDRRAASDTVFSVFALVASVVNWVWYIILIDTYWFIAFLAVPFVCAVILCSVRIKSKVLKILNSVVGAIVAVVFIQISIFIWLFGHIGTFTVVGEYTSPGGTYLTEVVNADHGTFGGDTLVKVYDSRFSLDLGLIEIYKKPDTVYSGGWGDWKNMSITWNDESTLVIDGKKYEID